MTKEESVNKVLTLISPAMEADGGGIDSFSIEDNIVRVKLKGTCTFCPSVQLTLKLGIEKTLKNHLDWVESVEKF